jgi:hypothetical protein
MSLEQGQLRGDIFFLLSYSNLLFLKTILMLQSGARGKTIHEKNMEQKILSRCPFKKQI